jgi:hypothetical protein
MPKHAVGIEHEHEYFQCSEALKFIYIRDRSVVEAHKRGRLDGRKRAVGVEHEHEHLRCSKA